MRSVAIRVATAEVTMHPVISYKYTLKISHPRRKADIALRKLDVGHVFVSGDGIKQEIGKVCAAAVSNIRLAGHGWKGRQELIDCDEDVKEMYALHGRRTDILLWYHVASGKQNQSRKRPTLTDTGEPVLKRGACAQKLTEVEEIVTELKSKHGNAYTIEKLNAWAHMGKHSSCDLPPNVPYFKGAKNTGK